MFVDVVCVLDRIKRGRIILEDSFSLRRVEVYRATIVSRVVAVYS